MKEAYKRELVRGWCLSIAPPPFVETINNNATPPAGAPVWWTIEWEPDQVEPIAYCGVVQETGLLAVIVAGDPNVGDQAVAGAMDAIVPALLAKVDPLAALTLERAQATVEHTSGGADRYYRLRTPIDYRLVNGGP
jgi:hypothetical protein